MSPVDPYFRDEVFLLYNWWYFTSENCWCHNSEYTDSLLTVNIFCIDFMQNSHSKNMLTWITFEEINILYNSLINHKAFYSIICCLQGNLLLWLKAIKLICFQCHHAPGHLVGLLQIVVTPSIDISIRQVASIEFKNAVGRHWSNDTRNGS